MKVFKRCIVLSLLIILMTGVSGCMKSNEKIMLAHLKEKYGQEFVSLGTRDSGHFGRGADIILDFYLKDGDVKDDYGWLSMSKGSRFFEDSYFGVIIREDLEADVLVACTDMGLPMKAYFYGGSYSFDESFDKTKTYTDFKEWNENNGFPHRFDIEVWVFIDGYDEYGKKECADEIFDRIESDGYHGEVEIHLLPSKAFLEITQLNRYELKEQYYDEYAVYYKSLNSIRNS